MLPTLCAKKGKAVDCMPSPRSQMSKGVRRGFAWVLIAAGLCVFSLLGLLFGPTEPLTSTPPNGLSGLPCKPSRSVEEPCPLSPPSPSSRRTIVIAGDSNMRWLYHHFGFSLSKGAIASTTYGHNNFTCRQTIPGIDLQFYWLPTIWNISTLPPGTTNLILNTGHWNFKPGMMTPEARYTDFMTQYLLNVSSAVRQSNLTGVKVFFLSSLSVNETALASFRLKWLYNSRIKQWNAAAFDAIQSTKDFQVQWYDSYQLSKQRMWEAGGDGLHYTLPSPWETVYSEIVWEMLGLMGLEGCGLAKHDIRRNLPAREPG